MGEEQVEKILEILEKKGFCESRLDANGKKLWRINQKGLDYLQKLR